MAQVAIPGTIDGASWLAMAAGGVTRAEATAAFDRFPPLAPEDLIGKWRGGGIPTGHPLDGLLEAYGWWGKEFRDAETVFPLLFERGGKVVALDPQFLPVGMVAKLRPHRLVWTRHVFSMASRAITTGQPGARVRMVEHRGKSGAAMIYDRLPIIDHFRRAAPGMLLGLMDLRGMDPFFFTLRRED